MAAPSTTYRSFLYIIVMISAVWGIGWLDNFLTFEATPLIFDQQARPETFVMEDFRYQQSEAGKPQLQIIASLASSMDRHSSLSLQDIDASFLSDGNRTVASSRQATYDIATRKITLSDQVQVTTADGLQLKTELLFYFVKIGKIITGSDFVLQAANFSLTGRELIYEPATSSFSARDHIVCDIW